MSVIRVVALDVDGTLLTSDHRVTAATVEQVARVWRAAIDQACADLVNQALGFDNTAMKTGHEPGGDKFRGVNPHIDWETTLEHAEKMGLGSREYTLETMGPLGKGW